MQAIAGNQFIRKCCVESVGGAPKGYQMEIQVQFFMGSQTKEEADRLKRIRVGLSLFFKGQRNLVLKGKPNG